MHTVIINFYLLFRHGVEVTKIKDMTEAAEKIRRERWIDDKTKKIKVGRVGKLS